MMLTTSVCRACLAGGVFSLLAIGCGGDGKTEGPTGEVEGTVTVDGKPLTEGSVSFYQPETGESGGAELGAGGKFKLESPLPVGKYQVAFQPPDPPQPDDEASGKLASKITDIHVGYQDGSTSEIVAEVKEGSNPFTFKLSKKGPTGSGGSGMPP